MSTTSTAQSQKYENAMAFAQSLRKLATIYEKHPDLPLPYRGSQINVFVQDETAREELAQAAKSLAPYKVAKVGDDSFFHLKVVLGEFLHFGVYAYRHLVCERKQVGTKPVSRQVAVTTREEIVQEPVYEWTCPDSLLGGAK